MSRRCLRRQPAVIWMPSAIWTTHVGKQLARNAVMRIVGLRCPSMRPSFAVNAQAACQQKRWWQMVQLLFPLDSSMTWRPADAPISRKKAYLEKQSIQSKNPLDVACLV